MADGVSNTFPPPEATLLHVSSLKLFFPPPVASLCTTLMEIAPPPSAAAGEGWVFHRPGQGGGEFDRDSELGMFRLRAGGGWRCFAPGRVTFCADRKSPKIRLGEGGFRFPPSLRKPIPLKRPISSSRTSYPSPCPKGQGSLIPSLVLSQWNPLRWASIGFPLRPPIGCTPRGLAVPWKVRRKIGGAGDETRSRVQHRNEVRLTTRFH